MTATGSRHLTAVPNGDISFWHTQVHRPRRRPALDGDLRCDVAIVGGGLTGLWTAYYLKQAAPDLDVVVLEAEFAGFGASGRNGGWLSAGLVGSREKYAAAGGGRQSVLDLTRAMQDAISEVTAVAEREGIDADIHHGGNLLIARNPAQLARLHDKVSYLDAWGEQHQVLSAGELRERLHVGGALGAAFTPHCATLQPAKLVQGLADVVERSGVRIFEGTRVTAISEKQAHTNQGTVQARAVLRCLEGFTASVRGLRREWLPMNSSMIVTEPLPPDLRQRIGWNGRETLGDTAHAYMYAQFTVDGRIAMGGRGVPYRFGSRTDDRGRTQPATIAALTALLHDFFPAAANVPVAHAWCGVLGVPRDWCATVNYDPATGLGAAGGYVGSGLTTTNLAGRTLADLVLERDTAASRLPWVGRRVRRWEPEPLRWAGVQAIYALYRAADRSEQRTRSARTSRWASVAGAVSGR